MRVYARSLPCGDFSELQKLMRVEARKSRKRRHVTVFTAWHTTKRRTKGRLLNFADHLPVRLRATRYGKLLSAMWRTAVSIFN